MLWVDPTDPEVLAAVAGDENLEDPAIVEAIEQAVVVASELLTLATGFKVHPVGEITEEFVSSHATRLSLLWGPVTDVSKVVRVHPDDDAVEYPLKYRHLGQMVYLNFGHPQYGYHGSLPLWRVNWIGHRGQYPVQHLYRVTYRFANTVTPAARRALLTYAHEIFLFALGSDECDLPERVTSITREGLGIQIATPQEYLDKGRTGIPSVDAWLTMVNPAEGAMRGVGGRPSSRPSQVFTPDSPPGVGTRLRRLP